MGLASWKRCGSGRTSRHAKSLRPRRGEAGGDTFARLRAQGKVRKLEEDGLPHEGIEDDRLSVVVVVLCLFGGELVFDQARSLHLLGLDRARKRSTRGSRDLGTSRWGIGCRCLWLEKRCVRLEKQRELATHLDGRQLQTASARNCHRRRHHTPNDDVCAPGPRQACRELTVGRGLGFGIHRLRRDPCARQGHVDGDAGRFDVGRRDLDEVTHGAGSGLQKRTSSHEGAQREEGPSGLALSRDVGKRRLDEGSGVDLPHAAG